MSTEGPVVVAVNHTALVSGAEAVMLRTLEAARHRGWTAVVACPDGQLADQVAEAGMGRIRLPNLMLPAGPRRLALGVLAARHAEAARRLRREAAGADLVIANGIRVLPTLRLARLRAPVAWMAHSMVDRPRWQRLVRTCAPAVDLAVAVSHAVAGTIDAPGLRVEVVHNGTPWPVAPAEPGRPEPPVVGCAAVLTSWKGQHVLLEAVAELGRPDVTVELLGAFFPKDRDYVLRLRERAARPDLAGRVGFVGHVQDPLSHVRRWSVAVVASTDPEAGPLALLEAMSVGIPVVATNHGGVPEAIGEAGVLVAPDDPSAMADAIRRLLDDADLHRRCSAAGPARIESVFALDRQLEAGLDVLESAMRAGRRARARRSPAGPVG